MRWRWTAHRLIVSAFLVFHLAVIFLWVSPTCPVKQRFAPYAARYIVPLGLWQYWAMFSPDPARDSFTLEAEVIDAQGIRHPFGFPRLASYSKWRAVPRFRYSKYAANLQLDEFYNQRLFAARHVLRQLKLPTEAYPLDVRLFFDVRPTPPPGGPPADPLTPTWPLTIGNFTFAQPGEIRQ